MANARVFGAVVLSVSMLLIGCGGHRSDGPRHVGESSIDLYGVTLPLDGFDFTEAEREITARARYLLTQRCARRFGADLPARRPGPLRASRGDRYGLSDEATARTWGYSLDAPPTSAIPWEMEIDTRSRLFLIVNGRDPQGRPASITGLPDGGCHAAAARALGQGAAPGVKNPIPELDDRAWRTSRRDPAVRATADGWKRCMARDGYGYENPVEAPYVYWSRRRMAANPHPSPEQRKNGIPPTAAERRAALADVKCKRESGFLRAWVAADAASQRKLIAQNLRRLQEHRRSLDRVVQNAGQALSRPLPNELGPRERGTLGWPGSWRGRHEG